MKVGKKRRSMRYGLATTLLLAGGVVALANGAPSYPPPCPACPAPVVQCEAQTCTCNCEASQPPTPRLSNVQAGSGEDRHDDEPKPDKAAITIDEESHPQKREDPDEDVASSDGWLAAVGSELSKRPLTILAAILTAVIAYTLLHHHWSVTRPWVIVTVESDNVMDAVKTSQRPPHKLPFLVQAAVRNYGSVPGWLIQEHSSLRVIRHPLESASPSSWWQVRRLMRGCPQHPLRPGREDFHAFCEEYRFNDDEWNDLQNGVASVLFFGFFRYKGVRRKLFFPYPVAWFAWEWRKANEAERVRRPGVVAATGPAEPKHWTCYT